MHYRLKAVNNHKTWQGEQVMFSSCKASILFLVNSCCASRKPVDTYAICKQEKLKTIYTTPALPHHAYLRRPEPCNTMQNERKASEMETSISY